MADRIITLPKIRKIWNEAKKDKSKGLEFLKVERKYPEEALNCNIGYIDYLKVDSTFFLKDVIIFPLFGADGKIKGVNTRKLKDKFFIRIVGSSYPLIYSKYEFYKKTLVLTESPICALNLKPFLPNMDVSASLSASLTVQQLTLLSTAKKIITVLDNDHAGIRCSADIEKYNPNTYVTPLHVYEGYKDVNDMYQEDTDTFFNLVEYISRIDKRTK